MAVLRANFLGGLITANLTSGATSHTMAAWANLPEVVAPNTLKLTLGSEIPALGGAPEIVYVTAHTAGSTTIPSMLRGREGTSARAHNAATLESWRHAATGSDYVVANEKLNVTDPRCAGGAAGDNSTDDTAAFAAAITMATAAPGGVLTGPPAYYRITSPLAVTTGHLRIAGAGRGTGGGGTGTGAMVLRYDAAAGFCLDVSTSGPHRFSDFTIDGSDASGSAGGLRVQNNCPNVNTDYLSIVNFLTSSYGMQLEGATLFTHSHTYFINNNQHVYMKEATVPCSDGVFLRPQFNGAPISATNVGIRMEDVLSIRFVSPLAQSNGQKNLFTLTGSGGTWTSCAGFALTDPYFEDNGGEQSGSVELRIQGFSGGDPIVAPKIRGGTWNPSLVDNPTYHVLLGNTIGAVFDDIESNFGAFLGNNGGNNSIHWGQGNKVNGAVDAAVNFAGQRVNGPASPLWYGGNGSPEGVVTAPIGSIYSRADGGASTSLYIKEAGAGNTGWRAV